MQELLQKIAENSFRDELEKLSDSDRKLSSKIGATIGATTGIIGMLPLKHLRKNLRDKALRKSLEESGKKKIYTKKRYSLDMLGMGPDRPVIEKPFQLKFGKNRKIFDKVKKQTRLLRKLKPFLWRNRAMKAMTLALPIATTISGSKIGSKIGKE